jgi:hypothetical protein
MSTNQITFKNNGEDTIQEWKYWGENIGYSYIKDLGKEYLGQTLRVLLNYGPEV